MTSPTRQHRRLHVLRGTPEETRRRARRLVAELDPADLLWVEAEADGRDGLEAVSPSEARNRLGQSYVAVVLDMHDRLDADLLGQSHGFVWGGGALILRLPPSGERPRAGDSRLAAYPYGPEDVGGRFWRHVASVLRRAADPADEPISPAVGQIDGTSEQSEVAGRIAHALLSETPRRLALLADRGRGKSSALGLGLASALRQADLKVAVTARYPEAAGEVFRFALGAEAADEPPEEGSVAFRRTPELLTGDASFDAIIVDEAAQLPVPVLRRLVDRHPDTTIAFATTTHGYEGTGRGFSLRFLDWLDRQPVPLERMSLREPIRWGSGDPLEAAIFDALLLDAEPAPIDAPVDPGEVEHRRFDRDALADEPALLREFFGLLIQAHYRTTPEDLHRMLDAPNLNLHALLWRGRVVAATWVAEEGGLTPEICDELYTGQRRMLGHALPEVTITKLGYPAAGELEMMRSVRIAVHPEARRRGLGTRLVDQVHAAYDPDLFGTLFGATPGLLEFRRSVGYEVARMGASRGLRTGEPSVTMMRPVSEAAGDLFERLRADFARKLPGQVDLMEAGDGLPLDPDLRDALSEGLPEPEPLSEGEMLDHVYHYAFGPRTYMSAAFAVEPYVAAHADRLGDLEPTHRALIEARVLQHRPWPAVTRAADLPSIRAAMRGLRRALRALVQLQTAS